MAGIDGAKPGIWLKASPAVGDEYRARIATRVSSRGCEGGTSKLVTRSVFSLCGAAEVAGNPFSCLTKIRPYPHASATAGWRSPGCIISRVFVTVRSPRSCMPHSGPLQVPAAGRSTFVASRHTVSIAHGEGIGVKESRCQVPSFSLIFVAACTRPVSASLFPSQDARQFGKSMFRFRRAGRV